MNHPPQHERTPVPPQLVDPLANAIGRLAMAWAGLELMLDAQVAVIYQLAGGRHLERELPKALNRRINFLRRCYRQIAALSGFSAKAAPLLDETDRLSETRHTVIHGAPAHCDPSGPSFIFVRMEVNKDKTMHKGNELSLTLGQIVDCGRKSQGLADDFYSLANRLMDAFMTDDQREKVFGTLGGK